MTAVVALWLGLALGPEARAQDDDGDGFTVDQGDCNDADPNTWPGAPERCDGIDNDCDQDGVIATELLPLGHGGSRESLAWRASDGRWVHGSGAIPGEQWLEPIDLDRGRVLGPLEDSTYGPDWSSALMGLAWYEPLGLFVGMDSRFHWFHVDDAGQFTERGNHAGTSEERFAIAAQGSTLFMTGTFGSYPQLFTVDPADGAVLGRTEIQVALASPWYCGTLAADPTSGELWTTCSRGFGAFGYDLVRLDRTGVGWSVGQVDPDFEAMSIDDAGRMIAVTSDWTLRGRPETLYELTLTWPGGPEPGELDLDGDGFLACEECNDSVATAFPGAPEICDGYDSDCDGVTPADEVDADADGVLVCEGDCDDADRSAFPGATEGCDGVDNDCDGTPGADEIDSDGDGWMACEECNDSDPALAPGQMELCDGLDNNCDGRLLPGEITDTDGDGWAECMDCDDRDRDTYPGAPELCDGRDNDCDGEKREDEVVDGDEDGWPACFDCDDARENRFPGNEEVCDGEDNDCDGLLLPQEADRDGDGSPACFDCDDEDPATFPMAEEQCDGVDNDCDGHLPWEEVDADDDGVIDCRGSSEGRVRGEKGCGCAAGSGPAGLGWTLALVGLAVRRRQPSKTSAS